jgi:hypothetical protein
VKRTALRRYAPLQAKTSSDSGTIKENIQALLRQIAIKRDGGCVLRNYSDAGACGGYGSKSGKLILQAEHLVTRANSISFGDMRNIVCLCQHHHGHFKPQHSRLYWDLIREHIGEECWAWIKRVEADKKPYRFHTSDWAKIEAALKQELASFGESEFTVEYVA